MPNQLRYTKLEIAERLRKLAGRASEPEKTSLLNLAAFFGRDRELVDGSREAITESKKLLARADKLLR
jgi:hypothetical protein